MKRYFLIQPVLLCLVLASGCGPMIFTRTHMERLPYNASEYRQEKSGLIVEYKEQKNLPPEFNVNVQSCDKQNQPLVNSKGAPVMTSMFVLPQGCLLFKYDITNNTDHVVRLNSAVIRLFDPAGNDYEPLDKDSLTQLILSEQRCQSIQTAVLPKIKLMKLIGKNSELLPDLTTKGYLVFKPANQNLPGTWALRLYEIPVKTDAAGRVTQTEKFEVRSILKKFIYTYRKESLFARAVKIDTREVE